MGHTTKRTTEIDILYSIGAFLAVLGHSHPGNWGLFDNTIFYHIIVFIYSFHMPLFFAIAGYLLINSKSIRNKTYGNFIKEKAQKLLTPYIVLSVIFMIPKGFLEFGDFSFLSFRFFAQTLFAPRYNTWGHFWFLPVLFICYLLFSLLAKLVIKLENKKAWFVLAIVFLLCFLMYFFPIPVQWLAIKDVCTYAIYMMIGFGYGFLKNAFSFNMKTPAKAIVCIFSLIVSVVIYLFAYKIEWMHFCLSCFMLLFLVLMAKILKDYGKRFFLFISKNVFTIYIYSWIFQSFTEQILLKLDFSWQVVSVMMFAVGILLPLFVAFLYKKMSFLNCKFLDLCLGVR